MPTCCEIALVGPLSSREHRRHRNVQPAILRVFGTRLPDGFLNGCSSLVCLTIQRHRDADPAITKCIEQSVWPRKRPDVAEYASGSVSQPRRADQFLALLRVGDARIRAIAGASLAWPARGKLVSKIRIGAGGRSDSRARSIVFHAPS
jgi:hypothetical protein